MSGIPHNPPPSARRWLREGQADEHRTIEEYDWLSENRVERSQIPNIKKYSHTYPERFWPTRIPVHTAGMGIRFRSGDLDDVVALLREHPDTRQAYLPVFFPEDTGAHHGERIPCTLGYHFIIRDGQLNVAYFIRSCDFVRHFRDDVYMAARLGQWMRDQLNDAWDEAYSSSLASGHEDPTVPDTLHMGFLNMSIVSLHCFEGDLPKLRREYARANRA